MEFEAEASCGGAVVGAVFQARALRGRKKRLGGRANHCVWKGLIRGRRCHYGSDAHIDCLSRRSWKQTGLFLEAVRT